MADRKIQKAFDEIPYCFDCGCFVEDHVDGHCINEIIRNCGFSGLWNDEIPRTPARRRISKGEQTVRFAETLTRCMEKQEEKR